ncbi:MAG: hypothetical protein DRP03_03145 [Candidatus Aenigmatarchaeota archaeon]|nr:MAG: hypothetical protein DRP03_03145 [Candidatus Aenigmarchaeota archaeon]
MLYTTRTFNYEYSMREADVVLLGIPFSSTEIGNDTRHGPLFIRNAIKMVTGYDSELGVNPFKKFKFHDAGDVEVVQGNWKITEKRIIDTVDEIFNTKRSIFPVFIGGEHLITLAIVNALKKIFGNFTIVQLDAHADLMNDWMGSKYSHITWAYHVLKDEALELVQIGVRSFSEHEKDIVKRLRKSIKGEKPLYLTIDLDVIDGAICNDVGTPEIGGMKVEELMQCLARVFKNKVIGMDIVECAARCVDSKSALIAANIIKRCLALLCKSRE